MTNEYVKDIVAKIPFEPGIYMMKDEKGEIIYVGKAISLRKRVRQYFQKNNKTKNKFSKKQKKFLNINQQKL